jgi:hypothetical protein
MGDIIVIAVLGAVVFLAVRSLRKSKEKGGCCGGNCASCKGCH